MIFAKPKKIDAFTIAVGNLTFGGTGKTPLCVALAKKFSSVILMRGYQGTWSSKGAFVQKDPGTWSARADLAKCTGDEAVLYLEKGIPVLIGANRWKAWEKFPESHRNVVILDDGLQHRTIQKDFTICVLDASAPMEHYRLPPFGRLRSLPKKIHEAQMVLISRAHLATSEKLMELQKKFHLKEVFFLREYSYRLEHFFCEPSKYHLVVGLGNPHQVLADARKIAQIEQSTFLRDHGIPSESLIQALNKGRYIPLLTPKDAVKWAHRLDRFAILHQHLNEDEIDKIVAHIPVPSSANSSSPPRV